MTCGPQGIQKDCFVRGSGCPGSSVVLSRMKNNRLTNHAGAVRCASAGRALGYVSELDRGCREAEL